MLPDASQDGGEGPQKRDAVAVVEAAAAEGDVQARHQALYCPR